jgi:hypothetical protein
MDKAGAEIDFYNTQLPRQLRERPPSIIMKSFGRIEYAFNASQDANVPRNPLTYKDSLALLDLESKL